MDDYTPQMGELISAYVDFQRINGYGYQRSRDEADRAIAAHDAEVIRTHTQTILEAQREAIVEQLAQANLDGMAKAYETISDTLRSRAAAIRSAATGGESP